MVQPSPYGGGAAFELPRGAADVSPVSSQYRVQLIHRRTRFASRPTPAPATIHGRRHRAGKVLDVDQTFVGQRYRPSNRALELADVPWPVEAAKAQERLRREAPAGPAGG